MTTVSDRQSWIAPDDRDDGELRLSKSNCASIDVDQVWKYLGKYGRYQVTSLLLVYISLWPQSISILSGVFVGMSVNHRCHRTLSENISMASFPNGSHAVAGECSVSVVTNSSDGTSEVLQTEPCYLFEYDSDVPTSFIAEWDLVCDSETLGQLPQMLTMVGMMIGAMTLPQVGDRYGRRTLALGSQIAHLLVSVGLAYAPAFEIFLLLKFLSGAFNQGFMVTQYIIMMELVPTELRTKMSLVATMMWVGSVLSLVPFAYVFIGSSWRTLQLAYGLISLSCFTLFFLDESLRWLLVNRRVQRASSVLKKACRMNGKSYEGLLKLVLQDNKKAINGEIFQNQSVELHNTKNNKLKDGTKSKRSEKTNPSFQDVLRCPTMRNISCIVIYSWMVNSLTYYGITLLSTSLAGDPYVNFTIGAVLEVPSTVCMFLLLTKFGRKSVVISFTAAAGVSLLAAVLIATLADNSYSLSLVQTGLTLFGKFCIAASFNIMWLYTPELYPTNLRNMGVGMSSMGARIAASASPFFSILARKAIWAPGALFAAACFLCVFLLTFLPETGHRELPSTIAEVEGWYRADRRKGGHKTPSGGHGNTTTFTKIRQEEEEDDSVDVNNYGNRVV